MTSVKFLIVDDHPSFRRGVKDILAEGFKGAAVAECGNALEMLQEIKAKTFDLVIMDISMPELNGLDATRELRTTPWGRAATVIALTGWGQDTDRERSRAAGCDGHLVKPVHLQDLLPLLAPPAADRAPLRP